MLKIPGKIKSLASNNCDTNTNTGTPTKTKPGKRSKAEAGLLDQSPHLRVVSRFTGHPSSGCRHYPKP